MKKILIFLFAVFIMIGTASLSVQAQRFNFFTEKSISNIGKEYQSESDGYYFEVCPLGSEATMFGFYGGNQYIKLDGKGITNGRITTWFGGFSLNALTENNLFFKMNIGLKQATVRYEKLNCNFNDYQKNLDFDGLLSFGYYNPEATFFSRTMFTIKSDQPFVTKKKLYCDNAVSCLNDSLASDLQKIFIELEETVYQFSLNEVWSANLDFNIGYSHDHPMLQPENHENFSYFIFGGNISVFGGECFYQNMFELYAFNKIGGFQPGWNVGIKINIVPLVFLLMGEDCGEEE